MADPALPAEFALIARHFRPLAGPGALDLQDDAAIVAPPAGRDLVLTIDAMVAGFKLTKRLLDAPALKALQTSDVFTAGVESENPTRSAASAALRFMSPPEKSETMGTRNQLADDDGAPRSIVASQR